LHSKLLTRDFFFKSIAIADTETCVLYTGQESIQHLFFACPFSAFLWSLCRLKLGLSGSPIGSLQDEALMLQSKFKKKTKSTILANLTLVAVTWHI